MEVVASIFNFFEQKKVVGVLEARLAFFQPLLDWPATITIPAGILLLFLVFLLYSGMLHGVKVQTDSSPKPKLTIAYIFGVGGYRESAKALDDWRLLYPNYPRITILYNSPVYPAIELEWNKKARSYAIGFVVNQDCNKVDEKKYSKLRELGFRFAVLPHDSFAVTSTFVHRNYLSLFFASQKIFAPLRDFVDDKHLCAHPIIQVDQDNTLNFFAPLSKQYDFYVKEASIFYGITLIHQTNRIRVVKDENCSYYN